MDVVARAEEAKPAAALGAAHLGALVARPRVLAAEDGEEVGVARDGAVEQLHRVALERHLSQLHVDLRLGRRRQPRAQPRLEPLAGGGAQLGLDLGARRSST